MAGEKKRRRLRRSRYVEILNRNQIPPTTPPQTALDQPSISIDTDRNLDLDLRQTGSRSIDQPKIDPDSENRRSSRCPQRRLSFRSATLPQEADRPIRIRSTSPLPPPPYIRQVASTLTSQGLLNGTRLLIQTLGRRVIQAKIMAGTHAGHIGFIPRIALTTTKDCHLPFTLTRRQFPIKPSYAMTINKSQGQTYTKVGIYLP